MKSNGFLFKSAIIYTIGSFLTAGLAFLTTPIFTRMLTVEEYGIVAVFNTWVNIMIILVGLETSSTISIANIKFQKKKLNEYLSSILLLSTLSFFIIFVIILVFRSWIIELMDISFILLVILLFQSFFGYIQQFYNTYLIQTKNPKASLILSVSFSLISTLLAIIMVISFKENKYLGQIIGKAIVVVIYGVLTYFIIIKKSKPKFNKEYWSFCLPLSIPIIFHLLSATVLSQADRIMIQKYVGIEETGIYSFAYIIATVLSILWQASNKAWVPWYLEQTKLGNRRVINNYAKEYMVFFSCATLGLMLIAPEITQILGPASYQGGVRVTIIVMFGIYFNFLYSFLSNYEFYKEKTKWIAIGTVLSALVNFVLNIVFIPLWGSMGAAITTLISYIMLFIFHSIIATRMEGYNIYYSMILKNIFFTAVGFIFVNVVLESLLIRLSVIVMLFIFILYKVRIGYSQIKSKRMQ